MPIASMCRAALMPKVLLWTVALLAAVGLQFSYRVIRIG